METLLGVVFLIVAMIFATGIGSLALYVGGKIIKEEVEWIQALVISLLVVVLYIVLGFFLPTFLVMILCFALQLFLIRKCCGVKFFPSGFLLSSGGRIGAKNYYPCFHRFAAQYI